VADIGNWQHLDMLQFIMMGAATFAYVYKNYLIVS
jgi:hypothetical protein